ncbi:hypothetical protein CRG98_014100 [Punica granatum]|uniref:Isopenicillin N synthase-like Fe(2+) 2OG dioxygenase domain-containing protein n=1 Tax=Punica granatum TaxID=22663 RepID=A0A2I0KBA5_PUNGR|nr:hypothetical protein CRG98_014100 [Punica granatum]
MDPEVMTLLLPDGHALSLQLRKDGNWITVKPVHHEFTVTVGHQIQIMACVEAVRSPK